MAGSRTAVDNRTDTMPIADRHAVADPCSIVLPSRKTLAVPAFVVPCRALLRKSRKELNVLAQTTVTLPHSPFQFFVLVWIAVSSVYSAINWRRWYPEPVGIRYRDPLAYSSTWGLLTAVPPGNVNIVIDEEFLRVRPGFATAMFLFGLQGREVKIPRSQIKSVKLLEPWQLRFGGRKGVAFVWNHPTRPFKVEIWTKETSCSACC